VQKTLIWAKTNCAKSNKSIKSTKRKKSVIDKESDRKDVLYHELLLKNEHKSGDKE
jgi:hypothetical protein